MGILDRSESRNGARVSLLAVHTTEGDGTAAALRDATWWTGSSHAITDNDPGSLLTPAEGCVPYERAAWTLRSGNRISENIEQVGWARWTRAEWLGRPKLLDNTARWLADRSRARGIPLVKLSPADVAAGKWGVIGHVDWTLGMRDGSHTDPGPNYPWDVVLAAATNYLNGDDMSWGTPTTQEQIDDMQRRVFDTQQMVIDIQQRAFETQMQTEPEKLIPVLRPILLDAVQAARSSGAGATADQIVDELVERLAARPGNPAS